MNIKKLVFILIGVVLISFGVGLLSLNHYGFKTSILKIQLLVTC